MSGYALYAFGFFAQALFGTRILVQWAISEREGKVVSPVSFWLISLSGSFLFLIYGVLRLDMVILIGQTFSFYIYVRNLQLKGFWPKIHSALRLFILIIPIIMSGYFLYLKPAGWAFFQSADPAWSWVLWGGVAGQLLLNLRYVYQWYFSEQAQDSILPLGFWIISAVASVMVVVYSLIRHDPVLLVAQSMGFFAYLRNIFLAARH